MSALQSLNAYLAYPFVRHALIAGLLIALCSSLLGVTLVLKRFSLIGDGLSHVAFSALSVATVLRVAAPMLFVLPVTIACAVAILCTSQNARIRGDASIAMLSVGSLAIGYLVLNLFGPSANLSGDVCTTLFGSTSILTLSTMDVWLCAALSLAVVVFFVLFYERLFAVTFDETFARTSGIRVRVCNLMLAIVVAVVIVLSMNLVGSLLISALIVFPALAAMRLCGSFLGVTLCSAGISVACALAGLLIAIMAGTPVGSTIVAADIGAFLLCALGGAAARRWKLHRTAATATAACGALLVMLLTAGCGGASRQAAQSSQTAEQKAEPTAVDLDLTAVSATMRYAHVTYIIQKPADYAGMKVRLRATCTVMRNVATQKRTYNCNISDSMGCCAVLLPFRLADADAVPRSGTEVTVTGTVSMEPGDDGNMCAIITDAILE